MTSKSLYFKLLAEDLKRRTWAIALIMLSFFFSLPVSLALNMENALNTDFFVYNNYEHLTFVGVTAAEKAARILELKTKVVLENVSFSNGLVAFLIIIAAVVLGVTGFSYLHNRKKVDFYHSIPVRREVLFAVQYTGGLLIAAAAYLLNLIFALGVGAAYGVPLSDVISGGAAGFFLNLLYFLLLYGTAVAAMMMTGKLLVGMAGIVVFFSFLPAAALILEGYCSTFFLTKISLMLEENHSLLWMIFKWGSPFSAYMMSLSWGAANIGKHIVELIVQGLCVIALALLGMQLYRCRPSETAGKAMAFKWSMAPIRILIVICCGLMGGIFFWTLQSTMVWMVFGVIMATVIAHCIIEIIYHADFKRLFSHKLQLLACLAAGILLTAAFRCDWFGYDSYLPEMDQVQSAAFEIDKDRSWINDMKIEADHDGKLTMEWPSRYEMLYELSENMEIRDPQLIEVIARECVNAAEEARDWRFKSHARLDEVEGIPGEATEVGENTHYSGIRIVYSLKNGRKVMRSYNSVSLDKIMEAYQKLFLLPEYKQGAYSVMRMDPDHISHVVYGNITQTEISGTEADYSALLAAYQQDLEGLTIQERLENVPIGQLWFLTSLEEDYTRQGRIRDYHWAEAVNASQAWPVYGSFEATLGLLKKMGVETGYNLSSSQIREIEVDRDLERDEQARILYFNDPEEIELLLQAFVLGELQNLNPLCPTQDYVMIKVFDESEHNEQIFQGGLVKNRITTELEALFED